MIVLTPVLMLVFISVITNMFLKSDPTKAKQAAKAASASAAVFDGKINWELPPPYPQNLRDPTSFGTLAPVNQAQTETDNRLVVKGIVYSEDNPCAVVGDRIVSKGDVVDGATVVKINPDSVEFSAGDKNWTQKVQR
jgi:type II secretory pathway component PulC